jgi:putative ABC transport system permease protein
MMSASGTGNRAMYWRIVHRLLGANRGRLFVILLALGAGAAVTAALLNLQVDAKRRITTEFRAFGPNVVVTARNTDDASRSLGESLFNRIPDRNDSGPVAKAALLYEVVRVSSMDSGQAGKNDVTPAVLVGYSHSDFGAARVLPPTLIEVEKQWKNHASGIIVFLNAPPCAVGQKLASVLKLESRHGVWVHAGAYEFSAAASVLPASGGPEDSQIFCPLPAAQMFLRQKGRISLIQISVPGTPEQIKQFIVALQSSIGDADVRPIRQFTEGEAKIYNRISGLLTATVGVVLLLTALCVMAAMTNVAMERRNDVGLMKAIGGATRRVLRLFMMEAALLGFAGGAIGAAAGIFLSIWLGKQVFGVAAQPRLIVYPVAVALTTIVAILSAYPLRRLASVRPASVFRGEA